MSVLNTAATSQCQVKQEPEDDGVLSPDHHIPGEAAIVVYSANKKSWKIATLATGILVGCCLASSVLCIVNH